MGRVYSVCNRGGAEMKILFCLGSIDKGGTQRVVSTLANYFSQENDITILTTSNKKSAYELEKNIKRISLDGNSKKNTLSRLLFMKKIFKTEEFDLILTFQPEPSFRILILKKIINAPIILSVRNDPKTEYKGLKRKIFMRLLYPKADGFVFQTNQAKEYFSKKIQKNSIVIANPINDKYLIEPYLNDRDKSIVTVGRLTPQKNQKLLIDAFEIISKTHGDYELKIYGEGELEKELKEYADRLNLSNKIKFMGVSNTIENDIYKDGIFVLSSDYEGLPNSLMEAMTLGLPCISTDCPCGGPRELIVNNENGILVSINNAVEMAQAIKNIIEDETFAKKIGFEASRIREKYNSKKIVSEWEKYINLIRGKYDKH